MPLLSPHPNRQPSELPKHLYRTIRVDRLIDLILHKRMVLVKPEKWDDPFENVFFKYLKHISPPPVGVHPVITGDMLFGACWTTKIESDFGWRVYAQWDHKSGHPKRSGAIIKSKSQKLLAAIETWGDGYAPATCFIGKVEYLSTDEIRLLFQTSGLAMSKNAEKGHNRARGLLIKRNEFKHEEEYRIIVECWEVNRVRESAFIDIPVVPNDLIDSITLHPQMESEDVEYCIEKIKQAGYTGPITQSHMYRLPWDEDE